MDHVNQLTELMESYKLGVLVVAGVVGLLFGYYKRWSTDVTINVNLRKYLFGDPKAVGRALCALFGSLFAAGAIDFTGPMTLDLIIAAGFWNGYLIPQTIDSQQKAGSV